MKSALDLFKEFTASSFRNPEEAVKLFAEDAAFEIPYLSSLGGANRYEGREAITEFFHFVRGLLPGFELENIKVLIDTPDQVFAEYELTAVSSATGRTIRHLFFGRLVAKNGQITLIREALNTVEVARSLLPDGVPGLPDSPWSEN